MPTARPTTNLYVLVGDKFPSSGSSSGLSAGAIAAIAIGSVAAAAALGGLAWLLLRRQRRRRQRDAAPGGEDGKGAAAAGVVQHCSSSSGSLPGSGSAGAGQALAVASGSQQDSGLVAQGSGLSARGSGLSAEQAPLPELVQHVQAHDAAAARSLGSLAGEPGQHVLLCAESLPPRLRDWVVDPSAVAYCRWPNGSPVEIGRGASARVYKAMLNGEAHGSGRGGSTAEWERRQRMRAQGSPPPRGIELFLHLFMHLSLLHSLSLSAAGEVVAAKEVDIGQSPALQEAFVTECLRLQQLRHPNIVQVGCSWGLLLPPRLL